MEKIPYDIQKGREELALHLIAEMEAVELDEEWCAAGSILRNGQYAYSQKTCI